MTIFPFTPILLIYIYAVKVADFSFPLKKVYNVKNFKQVGWKRKEKLDNWLSDLSQPFNQYSSHSVVVKVKPFFSKQFLASHLHSKSITFKVWSILKWDSLKLKISYRNCVMFVFPWQQESQKIQ